MLNFITLINLMEIPSLNESGELTTVSWAELPVLPASPQCSLLCRGFFYKGIKPLTPILNQTREQAEFQSRSSTTDLPCVINEVLRKMNAHKLTLSKASTTLEKAFDERKLLCIKSSLEPRQRQKLHSVLCK